MAVQVIPSRDVKVSGLLGPAACVEKKSQAVADQSIGLGGTTLWKLASLDQTTTLAVFFEIMAANKEVCILLLVPLVVFGASLRKFAQGFWSGLVSVY